MVRIFALFLVLSLVNNCFGQSDSIRPSNPGHVNDTIIKANKKKLKDSLSLVLTSKPKRAFLIGSLIPGGGQIYNRDWLKLPFVIGGYAAIAYNFNFKQNRFKEFDVFYSKALTCKCKVTIREYPTGNIEWEAKQIKPYRDRYRDNRDVAIFIGIGVHLIIALEAYVHAHLKDFNIDQDLSLKLKPEQGSIGLVYNLH